MATLHLEPEAAPVGTFASLRVPDFRRLLAAVLVSGIGTHLETVAAAWVMLELTGSPFWVGLAAASPHLPRLVASIPAGALADAIDRRRLLIAVQTGNAVVALALALLTATGRLTPLSLVLLMLLGGVGSAAGLPAYQSLISDLLPRSLITGGVALNSATMNVARSTGPAIGGLLIAAGVPELAFGINAASYLALVLVLVLMRSGGGGVEHPERMWRGVVTGLRYARHTPAFLQITGLAAAFALTAACVQTLLPNVAREALGLGGGGYGVLLACFGVGAAAGAFGRQVARRLISDRAMIPLAISGYGVCALAFALLRVPALNGLMLAACGAFWVWTHTTMNASIQLSTPSWVRGRAMALYSMAFMGVLPLGALLAGGIAESAGAAPTVAAMGIATALVGLVSTRLRFTEMGDVSEQPLPEDWVVPPHAAHVAGEPVFVLNTWQVDPADVADFLAEAKELRRHRYRTGAVRWNLFRNAEEPSRMTEVFEVRDWEDHLRQHQRVDAEAIAAIRHLRRFDRAGGPTTRHLVGIDVHDPHGPPAWEELIAVHHELHASEEGGPVQLAPRREPA